MKKLLFYSLIFISSLSLSACLNVQRSIKFDAKGKGNEKMTVVLGNEFMKMISELSSLDSSKSMDPYDDKKFIGDITSALSDVPGIKINNISSVIGADSSNTLKIDYDFDKVSLISDAMKGSNDPNDPTDPAISYYTKGDSVYFTYMVNMNSGKEEDDSLNSALKQTYDELFVNDKMIVNIEFPFKVARTNGVISKGKNVTWNYPMKEVMKKEPVILTAVMKK